MIIDLGYMINHAMFQRNGKAGYVLKPVGLRNAEKGALMKVRKHRLLLTVRSCRGIFDVKID